MNCKYTYIQLVRLIIDGSIQAEAGIIFIFVNANPVFGHALLNDTDNLIPRCNYFVSAKVAIFFHSHKIEYK